MQLNHSYVRFDEERHEYWLGDKQLQGITGLLSRQLFPNKYSAVPAEVLNRAAQRGSRIHAECFTFDMFGTAESEEAKWYAELVEKEQLEIIDNEYLVSDNENYASAIDKVLKKNGELCLADVKTTYSLDKEYISWQLSIYKYLFELLNPQHEIKRLYAIWVRNGATLHEVEVKPKDVIKGLLECEAKGIQFINPYAPVVEDKESEKALCLIRELTEIATQIKTLEKLKSDYNAMIEELFNDLGADKWESDSFVITKTKSYERTSFDSKKFEQDNPELYKNYLKTTTVKGGIKTTLK